MPEASKLVLHVVSAVAEHERDVIRERTRAAMQAAKARGVKLGLNGTVLAAQHRREATDYAITIKHHIDEARASGATTLTAIVEWLNTHGVPSRQNGKWHPQSVARVIGRL